MPSDDESSDLSSLSSLSPVPSNVDLDDLSTIEDTKDNKNGILKFFSKLSEQPPKSPSPPPRKRSPSPPHEYVLADNPDIAFIVMFRSRFTDALPKSLANFGPQELERDVVEAIPGDRVEHFLCALLGLLLNRKQDVKIGHYNRALEDAIVSHKGQWPAAWEDKSPLASGASFNTMNPTERLTLLRYLILWAMASSDTLKAAINQSYKQNRHEDDLNQARSVQPWGSDADKRRYYLVEGQDDTAFRVYRESNPAGANRTWWSVAGTIDELKELSEKLEKKDGGPRAKKLSQKILQAVPRFEAGEEKRKKREYRQIRKEQFKRPESGLSMYEGRTRGKRVKYTYSDDEDVFFSDSTGYRRSSRNTGIESPAEPAMTTTASGRQVRAASRMNMADDSASIRDDLSEFDEENSIGPTGRPRRSAAVNHGTNGWTTAESKLRRAHTDSDASESEADFGDDEEDADVPAHEESEAEDDFDEDEAMIDDDLETGSKSLVVKLAVTAPNLRTVLSPVDQPTDTLPTPDTQDWPAKDMPLPQTTNVATEEVKVQVTPDTSLEPNNPALEQASDSVAQSAKPAAPASPVATTSLAFRGSPEKPPPQPLASAAVTDGQE